jgi:hypothetical protein
VHEEVFCLITGALPCLSRGRRPSPGAASIAGPAQLAAELHRACSATTWRLPLCARPRDAGQRFLNGAASSSLASRADTPESLPLDPDRPAEALPTARVMTREVDCVAHLRSASKAASQLPLPRAAVSPSAASPAAAASAAPTPAASTGFRHLASLSGTMASAVQLEPS